MAPACKPSCSPRPSAQGAADEHPCLDAPAVVRSRPTASEAVRRRTGGIRPPEDRPCATTQIFREPVKPIHSEAHDSDTLCGIWRSFVASSLRGARAGHSGALAPLSAGQLCVGQRRPSFPHGPPEFHLRGRGRGEGGQTEPPPPRTKGVHEPLTPLQPPLKGAPLSRPPPLGASGTAPISEKGKMAFLESARRPGPEASLFVWDSSWETFLTVFDPQQIVFFYNFHFRRRMS